jgi:hypothetical protein
MSRIMDEGSWCDVAFVRSIGCALAEIVGLLVSVLRIKDVGNAMWHRT